MLLLTSTSDLIRVVTSAAGTINCHASFADATGSPVTSVKVGRTNTPTISTATTTTVVGSPAAGDSRNVKSLKISNDHATISNTITLQHTDGANVVPLEVVTLAPGERLGYEEGVGIRVYDALGREKVNSVGLGLSGNSNTADVVASAADTYLAGSSIPIANRLQVGSSFHWTFRATKTAAGVAAATFNIRTGTAGAVGDASRCLHTFSAIQTAAVDTGWFELEANFRIIGSVAVLQSVARMDHTAADAAGMGTLRYNQVLSAAFDATPTGTQIGVSCNPGAAGVWTFQFVKVASDGLIS